MLLRGTPAVLALLAAGCSRAPLPSDLPGDGPDLTRPPAPPDLVQPDLRPPRPLDLVVVMESRPRGFYTSVTSTASLTFEKGPGIAPLALGALHLRTGAGTGADQGGRAVLSTSVLSGTALRELDGLSYSTYVSLESTAAAQLAPVLSLQVDIDGDGQRDTTLVFEPVYAPEQGGVRRGVWQTWNARAGRFWFTVATGAFCATTCHATLNEVLAAHPQAAVVEWGPQPGAALSVGQRAGGSWAGFDGAVDALVVSVRGRSTRYDFEPEAAACSGLGYGESQRPIFWDLADCVDYHQ